MTFLWIALGIVLSAILGLGWAAVILGGHTDDDALERYERERAAFEQMFE